MTQNGNSKAAAADPAAAQTTKAERRGRRRRRFAQSGRPAIVEQPEADESVAALRAELLVLREENIRLKSSQHGRPDVGRLLERARALPTTHDDAETVADEVTQTLAEGLVIRESLKEICHELQRTMAAIAAKLDGLSPTRPPADDWLPSGSRKLSAIPVEACETNGNGAGGS